jgi:prophage regulatory protein
MSKKTRKASRKIQKLPMVMHTTKKSRSAIYKDMTDGRFPKQIQLGSRAVGWLASDIQAWIDERVQERDQEAL